MENEIQKFNKELDIKALPIYTRSQLSDFNGSIKPQLYVAIKGFIYDVSESENYLPGKAYHTLVGKDISRLLGLNSLSVKNLPNPDNTWSLNELTEEQVSLVDNWVEFFQKKYPIVGVIVDHVSS